MDILNYHVRVTVEESPPHHYHEVHTDVVDESMVDPAFPSTAVRDLVIESIGINVPTCVGNVPGDLKIRTNVGSAIENDDYVVTADPSDKKYIKISIARDDGTNLLEILAFEKTTGEYGGTPAGKTIEKDLKEFSVVAAGIVLVEEQDWI